MRTTLTIEDELFHKLREEAVRTRRPFKDVLNERLRLGFSSGAASEVRAPEFTVKPFAAKGFASGVVEKKLSRLFDRLETRQIRKKKQ